MYLESTFLFWAFSSMTFASANLSFSFVSFNSFTKARFSIPVNEPESNPSFYGDLGSYSDLPRLLNLFLPCLYKALRSLNDSIFSTFCGGLKKRLLADTWRIARVLLAFNSSNIDSCPAMKLLTPRLTLLTRLFLFRCLFFFNSPSEVDSRMLLDLLEALDLSLCRNEVLRSFIVMSQLSFFSSRGESANLAPKCFSAIYLLATGP